MTPSPHPSTSRLRPLNPATSRKKQLQQQWRLHACVHAAEDIELIRVTRAKYSAPLPQWWAKRDYGQPTSHIHLLLVVFGFSFYCLFVYSVQIYAQLQHVESFTMDPFGCKYSLNDTKEDGGGSYWYMWTWPTDHKEANSDDQTRGDCSRDKPDWVLFGSCCVSETSIQKVLMLLFPAQSEK